MSRAHLILAEILFIELIDGRESLSDETVQAMAEKAQNYAKIFDSASKRDMQVLSNGKPAPQLVGCRACYGSGGKAKSPCSVCNGAGMVTQ